MFLSPECLEELKCFICTRLLSVFPVYININDQELSVCGRCQRPDDESYVRYEIYENIVKTVQFPCINKEYGCMDNIRPEKMKQHEQICLYRFESCTIQERNKCKCLWTGTFQQLFQHYKDEHGELLLNNNQLEFDIFEDHDFTNFLLYHDEMFLLQNSFDHITKRLEFSILPFGFGKTTTEYFGQIVLSTNDATLSKNLPIINVKNSIDINIESLYNGKDRIVMATIIVADAKRKLNYNKKLYQDISELMSCFSCGLTLQDSINNCGRHYTCSNCNDCCSADARRDEAIEQFLEFIYRKCPQRDCNFIGNKRNLENHRFDCLNAPIDCCFKDENNCQQPQRRHLFEHILEEHRDRIVDPNEIVKLSIDTGNKEARRLYNGLMICRDLFRLNINYDSPKLSFTINKFGLLPKNQNLIYEIRILDEDNVERIIISESCNIQDSIAIILHEDQIINLIFDKTLSFIISVSNNE